MTLLDRFQKVARGLGPLGREASSLAETAGLAAAGQEIYVDDAEYDRRLGICFSNCRPLRLFRNSPQCRRCGCFIKKKARLAAFHCDLGKW